MRTAIKYHALANVPAADRLKTLAGAMQFEFDKVKLACELAGPLAAYIGMTAANDGETGVKRVGGAPRMPPLTLERIKGFLAQKYATPADNPVLQDLSNQLEQFIHTNMPEMDLGWQLLFDAVPLEGTTHDHFDIIDTNAGITFTQRKPGEKTEIRRNISETKSTVGVVEYSDGLGLLDIWLQFNQFWTIDETIAEFRAKAFDKMAAAHYGLFTALGAGVDVAFDTDDTTTFNKAAAAILRLVKDKGYAAGTNAQFDIVCSPEKVGRIERMLTAQRGSAIVAQGTVKEPMAYRVRNIISTTHVAAADTGYYLVLAGRKIKRAVWKSLTIESARNAYVSATDLVGVMQFNAAIGDSDQVRRVKYA